MLVAFWDDEAVEHIAANHVSPAEVDYVLARPMMFDSSESSGRPIVFGHTFSRRWLAVIYEPIDELHVYVITAYEVKP